VTAEEEKLPGMNHLQPGKPAISRQDILAGLRQLGLKSGMSVVVHSSLSKFGYVLGGAEAVIQALMEVLGEQGTLLMPSFNHDVPFRAGQPGYYDPKETGTINGVIPDTFWRMAGVYRSLDPTHPVAAWGKHARRYTEFHHRTLTMGPESPLGLLGREGGYGLLMGVGYEVNTYHHVVETTCGAPCLGQRTEAYPVRLGRGRTVLGRTWGWRGGECPYTDQGRYPKWMEERGLHRQIQIGQATVTLFRLQDCFKVVAEMLTKGSDGFPPCRACPIRPRRVSQTVESDWNEADQCLQPDSAAWTY
jgi:aminoglycoside 3-N-acetyltransferase